MLYQSLALLAVTLASVSAFPTEIARRDSQDFVGDPNGNLKITFSDQTIKLGTISIDEIVGKLATACSTQGQCDTSSIDIKGQLVEPGYGASVYDETLTLDPSGDYPSWIHNGLIDALSAAVKVVAKCDDVHHTPTCSNPMAYCPAEPFTVNECTVPQYWGVNYQPPDLGTGAPPFIGADLTIKLDGGDFCSTFLKIGSAVAGAVNGAAGGIFVLAGLLCKK